MNSVDSSFKFQPVLGASRIPMNMTLTSSVDIPNKKKKNPIKQAFEARRMRTKKMSVCASKELPNDLYDFKPKLIGMKQKKKPDSKNVKSL